MPALGGGSHAGTPDRQLDEIRSIHIDLSRMNCLDVSNCFYVYVHMIICVLYVAIQQTVFFKIPQRTLEYDDPVERMRDFQQFRDPC